MANSKISALTAATTPLDGTEVLPIVKSGATVKVANNDLRPKQIQSNATSGVMQIVGPAAAATRVMTIPDANFTAARTDAAQTFTGTQTFGTILPTLVGVNISNPSSYAFNGATNLVGGDTTGNATFSLVSSSTGIGYLAFAQSTSGTGRYHGRIDYNQSTATMGFYTNGGVEAQTIDSSQNIKFSVGNLVQGTAAKGINFTANAAQAGMISQLLNWYEAGTWTPALKFGGNSTGMTYSLQTGSYTRIGRQVTVTCVIVLSAKGSSTGTATITGLPFTNASGFQFVSQGSVSFDSVTFTGQVFVQISSGSSSVTLQNTPTTGARGNLDNTNFSNSSEFDFTLTYFV